MPVQAVKINLGRARDFREGTGKKVDLLKLSIAVFLLSDGTFLAIHNRCPRGGELVNAVLIKEHLFCQYHDCEIHLSSGKVQNGRELIETFPVEVEEGFVYLTLE
ncbi:Rieske 2Fe-2S domain-containing protein [Guptibacillus hwajinpoensis]|uniref:Nitrite reductase (NADH) small subunit n=1 Tax=Guptibacillus hwajinpoensis TaxID=208199 RepID=A0ABU0K2V3_9BACL|nr:Rieske 2Fe-2S domain-containing protein [Alkalihalobacillus hemicentroti]MDQ0483691.1 nitrite reductase (NADH) small subunit [Alkalihalobacillus hemicentroti]